MSMKLTEVTILSHISRVRAVAGDAIFLYGTFSTVLAGIGSFAGIDELAIVQGNFTHDSLGIYYVSRLDPVIVDLDIAHATDQTSAAFTAADYNFATELESHCE